jgi:hypothetical protein
VKLRLNPRGHRVAILLIARQERNKFFVIDAINKQCTVAQECLTLGFPLRLYALASLREMSCAEGLVHAKTPRRKDSQSQTKTLPAAHGS